MTALTNIGIVLGALVAFIWLAFPFHPDIPAATFDYQFTVCSPKGGAHGVDFRSHMGVYMEQHGIKGWARNDCSDCVHGMFGDSPESPNYSPGAAKTLADVLADPLLVTLDLASKAHDMTTNVEKRTDKCEQTMPDPYVGEHPMIDWSFAKDCTDPCSCAPTRFADCSETLPLPANATYSLDCQRFPLGAGKDHFPDCNSIRRDPHNEEKNCFVIVAGQIEDSGKCTGGWIENTLVRAQSLSHRDFCGCFSVAFLRDCLGVQAAACCGPAGPDGNRPGRAIPPAPRTCSAFVTDAAYKDKCPK